MNIEGTYEFNAYEVHCASKHSAPTYVRMSIFKNIFYNALIFSRFPSHWVFSYYSFCSFAPAPSQIDVTPVRKQFNYYNFILNQSNVMLLRTLSASECFRVSVFKHSIQTQSADHLYAYTQSHILNKHVCAGPPPPQMDTNKERHSFNTVIDELIVRHCCRCCIQLQQHWFKHRGDEVASRRHDTLRFCSLCTSALHLSRAHTIAICRSLSVCPWNPIEWRSLCVEGNAIVIPTHNPLYINYSVTCSVA